MDEVYEFYNNGAEIDRRDADLLREAAYRLPQLFPALTHESAEGTLILHPVMKKKIF